ncbi:unnamed protein product [Fraxinus pennsylvanica]|uniref:Uncharacterized protein n=1 Tax=Fraxinus pennsylvanica TaxID=56036 RepID=A0AAD1ZUD6_9LAMI|nr:unnamed protein product [Fraxinus pennsylvanica]
MLILAGSAIVNEAIVTGDSTPQWKGAPESIQERLVHMPAFYVQTYKKYARQGFRVLALAYKSLPVMTDMEARSLERDGVEIGLILLVSVFSCPIRSDSAAALSKLKESSHDLVMITGDQALAACHVAGQSDIVEYRENAVEALTEAYDLCIGGDCIEMLQKTSGILKVIPHVKVFAQDVSRAKGTHSDHF